MIRFGSVSSAIGIVSTIVVVGTLGWGSRFIGAQTVGEALAGRGLKLLSTDVSSNVDDDAWKKIIEDNKTSSGNFLLSVFSGTGDMTRKIQEAKNECRGKLDTGNSSEFYNEAMQIAEKYCSVQVK